jgi:TolA-binding protein
VRVTSTSYAYWQIPCGLILAVFVFINPSQAKTAAGRAPKKTVGDLLKQVDTQARERGNVSIAKRKFALPQIEETGASPRSLRVVKPPPSIEIFKPDSSDEGRLEAAVDQEVSELFKLTRKYRQSPQRGELWLRLGELYIEKAALVKFRSQNDHDGATTKWEAAGKKGARPQFNVRVGDVYHKKAIQLYEWFVNDFPKDTRLPQALFFLGYNHFELGDTKKGAFFYDRVTKEFPNSPYVQETHFALGEYYFENEDWAQAAGHYQDVLKTKRAATYAFSMYKLAWCYYRLGKVNAALKTLEDVVRQSRTKDAAARASGLKQVNRVRLGNEAIRDIVPFYAEIGDYEKARSYFKSMVAEPKASEMLEQLGNAYSDLGKKQAGRYVFKQLIASAPTSIKAVDWQKSVVMMYNNAGEPEVFKEELEIWVKDYSQDSTWYKANEGLTEIVAASIKTREEMVRNYVLALHQVAQNSQAPYSLQNAREGYELYLRAFEDDDRTAEMHFFYGELLFDMKRYEEAGIQYTWVSDNAPKSRYHEEAVLNTVLAFERILAKDSDIKTRVGGTTQSVPFGEGEERFAKASLQLIKGFSKSERVPEVKYKLGRLHYLFNHHDEALVLFEDIVKNHPKSKVTVFAANLILDIYNIKKDYNGLANAGREFMNNPALVQAGLDSDVKNIVERASFKQAQDLEVQKDYPGSARAFQEFAKNQPNSKLTTSAVYNAGVNFERAGELSMAVAMYEQAQRSKDPAAEKIKVQSRQLLARLYEKTGQYERGAIEYEKLGLANPKDPKAPDFHYNAAVIFEALNNSTRAIKNYEMHFQLSKKSARAEALNRIAEIHERNGKLGLALKSYEQFIENNPQDWDMLISAQLKIAKIYEQQGKATEAEKWFRKVVIVQNSLGKKRAGVGTGTAAEAKYRLGLITLGNLRYLRIPANPKLQEGVVKEKLSVLRKLTTEMTDVIKYDFGPFVIAAMYSTGSAYEHMADALYNAPAPANLNAEEKKIYESEVDRVAAPFRQRAIENFRGAIDKANQIDVYNDQVNQARQSLIRYDKGQATIRENRVLPVQMSDRMGI